MHFMIRIAAAYRDEQRDGIWPAERTAAALELTGEQFTRLDFEAAVVLEPGPAVMATRGHHLSVCVPDPQQVDRADAGRAKRRYAPGRTGRPLRVRAQGSSTEYPYGQYGYCHEHFDERQA